MKKKVVFLALASSLLIAPAAFAGCDFEDMPSDHWAYQAVQKLCEKGILSGFPDKTFKGQRNVTRYELAASLTKIMDKLEGIDLSKQTQEVKDEVAKLQKDIKDQMDKMKDEADKMREDMKKEGDSLRDSILKAIPKVKMSGKVSTGMYVEQISGVKDAAGADVSELALRPVGVAKLNFVAPVYEDFVTAGLELSTGGAPYSSAFAKGTDLWAKKAFDLNKAYLKWNPCKEFEMGFGKFGDPFVEGYNVMDYDVAYEGMYIKPKFDWFTFTAGAFPLKLDSKQGMLAFDKSTFLAAGQFGFNFDWLKLDLGVFSYQNVDKAATASADGKTTTFDLSSGINGDGFTVGTDGKLLATGFNVVNLNLGFNFDLGVPVGLNINALKNMGNFDNFDMDLPSAGKTTDGKLKAGNTMGLQAGIKIGELQKSGFALGFDYGMIGSDATIGAFNSSPPRIGTNSGDISFGHLGTNVNYMRPYLEIGLADNVSLALNGWIINKLADTQTTDNTKNPSILSTSTYLNAKF